MARESGAVTWRRLLAGSAAGVLLTLSLPPLGWWPAGPLGVAVLWLALRTGGDADAGWRQRLGAGMAAGLGLYGPGLWWVTEFHAVGWVALVLVEALILTAGVALVGGRGMLGLPAALVLTEAVRGRWPFGGLPLAGLDLGQVDGPLLPVARLGGHLLLVAVVGVAGVGLAAVVAVARRRVAGLAALGLVAAAAVAGAVAPDGSELAPVRTAAVQGGGPRGLQAVGRDQRPVFDAHVAATDLVGADAQLVLWPEDVVNVPAFLAGSAEAVELEALVQERGVTLVAGVVEDDPDGRRFRNAAVAWAPDGRQIDRYDKVHRVPFGEYKIGRAHV
jgi:apolipoprotein N-acyltransferase